MLKGEFIMNWYKRSQSYEDVKSERQDSNDDPEDIQTQISKEYFSIGQNDEYEDGKNKTNFCWVWYNDKLLVKKGPGSHRMLFNKLSDLVFDIWRGWYDSEQDIISAVYPTRKFYNVFDKYTDKDIPLDLKTVLRKRFSKRSRIIVF